MWCGLPAAATRGGKHTREHSVTVPGALAEKALTSRNPLNGQYTATPYSPPISAVRAQQAMFSHFSYYMAFYHDRFSIMILSSQIFAMFEEHVFQSYIVMSLSFHNLKEQHKQDIMVMMQSSGHIVTLAPHTSGRNTGFPTIERQAQLQGGLCGLCGALKKKKGHS